MDNGLAQTFSIYILW